MIRSALVVVGMGAALLLTACQKPAAKTDPIVQNPTPVPSLNQSELTPVQPLDAYAAAPPKQMDPEPAYTPPPKPVTIKPAEKSHSAKSSHAEHGRTYVVQKGDTLSAISKKFYGTTTRWKDIYEANKARVKSPDKLQVGTKLIIP